MARYTFPFILLLIMAFAGGCNLVDRTDGDGAVLLRVANASEADFESVFVRFPQVEAEFGAVNAGEVTAYREMPGAYHYGSIRVIAEGDTLRLIPIDYVGEEPLDGGRYTFALDIEEENLELVFERN